MCWNHLHWLGYIWIYESCALELEPDADEMVDEFLTNLNIHVPVITDKKIMFHKL